MKYSGALHLKTYLRRMIWLLTLLLLLPCRTSICIQATKRAFQLRSKPLRTFLAPFTASKMSDAAATPTWTPPAKIEDLFARQAGNQFAAINSPVAGARTQQDLPDGNAAIQLYSLGTPNGTLMCLVFRLIRRVLIHRCCVCT